MTAGAENENLLPYYITLNQHSLNILCFAVDEIRGSCEASKHEALIIYCFNVGPTFETAATIKTTLGQRLVFAGRSIQHCSANLKCSICLLQRKPILPFGSALTAYYSVDLMALRTCDLLNGICKYAKLNACIPKCCIKRANSSNGIIKRNQLQLSDFALPCGVVKGEKQYWNVILDPVNS